MLSAWLLWLSVVMHGYCGYQWLSVVMHGYQWLYAWSSWLSVVMHGYQCLVHDLVVFKVGGMKALSSVFN